MPLAPAPSIVASSGTVCAAVVWVPVEAWGEVVQGVGLILVRGEVWAGERAQAWVPRQTKVLSRPLVPHLPLRVGQKLGASHTPSFWGGRVRPEWASGREEGRGQEREHDLSSSD